MKRHFIIVLFALCLQTLHAEKTALIFGITGQDGAYLTELLLDKGYTVHGVKRRVSSLNTERIDKFYEEPQHANRFFLHYGDLTDALNVLSLVQQIQPDELYNLAAQSDVRTSFSVPGYTAQTDGLGVLNVLEAVRIAGLVNKTKIYQASTSELFGLVQETPQKETTPFYPRSPYGVAKLYGYWIIKNYREAYNMFATNGILFNHESPMRGETFVTRKITRAVCRIKLGLQDKLFLGNLDSVRDWGYAKDYVEAMWLMLQQEKPDDFVVATGKVHSVRECVELAFRLTGIDIIWEGEGINEVGINQANGKVVVEIDPRYFRPTEVDYLQGDATKAKRVLGWTPKHSFEELITLMVRYDLLLAKKERIAFLWNDDFSHSL